MRTFLVIALIVPVAGCAAEEPSAPTWHRDVAPLVAQRCWGCHAEGGIGPVSLDTYASAAPLASLIAHVTAERTMPPFAADASGACGTFRDASWLSDEELATLAAWAEAGAPEGEPTGAPPARPEPAALARVDLTLDPGVEYLPDATLDDDYRCFVIDTRLAADRFMVAGAAKPDATENVHHVLLFATPSPDVDATVAALDAAEPGPGYTCFGGGGDPRLTLIGAFAPGGGATRSPAGTGLRLRAGSKVVMQIHYNLAAGARPDRTTIDLELTEVVEHEATILIVLDTGIEIPPQSSGVEVTTGAGLRGDMRLWGVAPHMHELGASIRVDSSRGCMVDIPRWDFEWQRMYWYERPMVLASGDTITVRCRYDNPTDRTVRWGQGTADEMCMAFFYVSP